MEYQTYIRSQAWRLRRAERLRFAGNCCEICDARRLIDVHHRTYDRLGAEFLTDLIVLCRECHALFHQRMPAEAPSIDGTEPVVRPKDPLVEAIRLAERVGDREQLMELMERAQARLDAKRAKLRES